MNKSEWYFEIGYVEILYAAMVVCIFIALHFFRRLNRASGLAPDMIGERNKLLGLLALAVVLFVLNRVLGDLW
ncbi:hypothetical protein [Nitrosospira briensis]|uniref:hypothetical protein n=1 Tax=Nitrosospira briensis TaxID=35799 RepID=UPI0008E353C1|nr:hypothetical protein [Nitrosospira briensis]SFN71869.1 hypothetical protein SAMN05216332_101336 [Nitrosospira briensis]